MELRAKFQFFCSHYHFDLFDSLVEWWNEPVDTPPKEEFERGSFRGGKVLVFRTLADLNNHRFDVFTADKHVVPEGVDRVMAYNIDVPSGKITVFSLDEGQTVEIGQGKYVVYCRAFNIARELSRNENLTDEQFLQRDDLERYELVFVPGAITQEGVVFGPRTLEPFYDRRGAERAKWMSE